MEYVAAGILTGLSCATLGYATLLESIHDRYTPDYTWVTVAGGFALICAGFWLWLWLEPLPINNQFAAFWRLSFLTCTAGCPIISWQIGQNRSRRDMRQRSGNSSGHGKGSASEIGSESGGHYDEDARRS